MIVALVCFLVSNGGIAQRICWLAAWFRFLLLVSLPWLGGQLSRKGEERGREKRLKQGRKEGRKEG